MAITNTAAQYAPPSNTTTALIARIEAITYKMATVCFCENPISISLWCKCPPSGAIIGFLFQILRTIAKPVSKIGSPRMRNGTINEIITYPLNNP